MTTKDLEIQSNERGLENMPIGSKELYFLTGTGTLAKDPKVGKLLRELKSILVRCIKKVHWLLFYVCNRKFAAFGCFDAE